MLIRHLDFGVVTRTKIESNKPLLEYVGDLISDKEGSQREKQYNNSDGNFLFFFRHNKKNLW